MILPRMGWAGEEERGPGSPVKGQSWAPPRRVTATEQPARTES